jgi:hypothetical protein
MSAKLRRAKIVWSCGVKPFCEHRYWFIARLHWLMRGRAVRETEGRK